jgi:hypothetical protein
VKRAFSVLLVAGVAAFATAGATFASPVLPVPDFPIGGTSKPTFLPECAALTDPKRGTCYVRRLLAQIEKSGDPARELPRIDRRVHANGGWLESWCHMLMHEVGRTWAARHRLTLENLYEYVPRSNDPGCSAGFGMGLVMYLGGELVANPRVVLETCTRLPTRFREYTCVHGAGHAFMRGLHGELPRAVRSCEALGAPFAPDCAQGAYHDYWVSLSGADDTTRPKGADTDPRSVCGRSAYPLPCWYRFFIMRRPAAPVDGAQDLLRLCRGLERDSRSGCLAGVSLLMATQRDAPDHARICGELSRWDVLSCLRGVNVPSIADAEYEQSRTLASCAGLERVMRYACYVWFGRTLTVATDGRFARSGCPQLKLPAARSACAAGARLIDLPLRTFS